MMNIQEVHIDVGGIGLEGALAIPEKAPKGCALFCHPYPPYGGSMDNNVVRAARDAFVDEDISTLVFNFRSVGASGGSFDDGRWDAGDIEACINFVKETVSGQNLPLYLGGYSYGSARAVQAGAGRTDLAGLVLVSPPVNLFDCQGLRDTSQPTIIIAGDGDSYCDLSAVSELIESNEHARLCVVPGADHFWVGQENRIAELISGFVRGPGK